MKKFVFSVLFSTAFILICLLLSNCKKDCENTLPRLTQTGKNIFACKIDGKCWIAEGYISLGTGIYIPAISGGFWPLGSNNKMNLYIVAQRSYLSRVELFIRNETAERFLKPGVYPLNKNTFVLDFASSFNQHLFKIMGLLI